MRGFMFVVGLQACVLPKGVLEPTLHTFSRASDDFHDIYATSPGLGESERRIPPLKLCLQAMRRSSTLLMSQKGQVVGE